jgi:hypothetical protein
MRRRKDEEETIRGKWKKKEKFTGIVRSPTKVSFAGGKVEAEEKKKKKKRRVVWGVIWGGEFEYNVCFLLFLTVVPVHIAPLFLLHLFVLYLPIPMYCPILGILSISLNIVYILFHHPIFFFDVF